MRVMHLLNHCNRGNGHVHVAVDLACAQSMNGYTVAFASGGGCFENLLRQNNVVLVHLTNTRPRPLSASKALAQLVIACRKFQPNLLHAHMMTGAVLGFIASKLTRVPLITTVHNSFDRHSALMRLGTRAVAVSSAERNQLVARGYGPDQLDVVLNGPIGTPRRTYFPG